MKKALNIFWIIATLILTYSGVHQFDHAHTSIQLVQGAFWMIIGTLGWVGAIAQYKDLRKDSKNDH